jgi:hypothetical protein
MGLPSYQTSDLTLTLLQSNWATLLNPLLDLPINQGQILENVQLSAGTNTINHKLGRKLQGWWIVRQRSSSAYTGTVSASLSNGTSTVTLGTTGPTTPTLCPFSTVIDDTNSGWSTSTNDYTVPVAGRYSIIFQPLYQITAIPSASQVNSMIIVKNAAGASIFNSISRSPVVTTGQFFANPVFYQNNLPAGYKISFNAWVDGAATVVFYNDNAYSRAYIQRISGEPPDIYDTQDTNPTPAVTLKLVSSASVKVDIFVF